MWLQNLCRGFKNNKMEQNLETNNDSKTKYSIWQLKQFNVQIWIRLFLLIVPFSILM